MASKKQHEDIGKEIEKFRGQVQVKVNEEAIALGTIYFIWHFPNWGKENNQFLVFSCQNKPSVRLLIYRFQKQHRDHFYYSTNQTDLVVDYTLHPNGRPTLGPYVDPPANINLHHVSPQGRMERRDALDSKLAKAVLKPILPGDQVGKIYYRWHYQDSNVNSVISNPIGELDNTEPMRTVLEEQHIKFPYHFYYSVNRIDMFVSPWNPTTPPRLGPFFPSPTPIDLRSVGQTAVDASSGSLVLPGLGQQTIPGSGTSASISSEAGFSGIAPISLYDDDEMKQRRRQMMADYDWQIQRKVATRNREYDEGHIYCRFYFSDLEDQREIEDYENAPNIRSFLYFFQRAHQNEFFYSTNQLDLEINPANGRPRLGPYDPPRDLNLLTIQALYRFFNRRASLKEHIFRAYLETMHNQEGYDIYYRWHYGNLRNIAKLFYPQVIGSTRETRPLIEDTHVNWPHHFYYSINHDDLIPDSNDPLRTPPTMGPIAPEQPAGQAEEEDMDTSGEPGTGALAVQNEAAPMPSSYFGLSMPVLVVPPANQEADDDIFAETLDFDDLSPTSDVPLDEWNALVDDINEGDEQFGDIGGMDHNIIAQPAGQAEVAQVQPNILEMAMQEANIDLDLLDPENPEN